MSERHCDTCSCRLTAPTRGDVIRNRLTGEVGKVTYVQPGPGGAPFVTGPGGTGGFWHFFDPVTP